MNNSSGKMKVWIKAARPRTLLLAVASVTLASLIAAAAGSFNWAIFLLTGLTATSLQILSNLANDYGDSIHGADSSVRAGPPRAVQSGRISAGKMRAAIAFVAVLTLFTGAILIILAIGLEALPWLLIFGFSGLAALWAAISYTAGSTPYGYAGLGDLAVLLFFGWVGVAGSYFLQTQMLEPALILPATSCGLFAVAVLNINNIRDMASDRLAGKKSVPVRLGLTGARLYHLVLLLGGFLAALLYVLLDFVSGWQLLFLLTLPLLIQNGQAVAGRRPAELDPYLKQMSFTALLFAITLGAGQLLA